MENETVAVYVTKATIEGANYYIMTASSEGITDKRISITDGHEQNKTKVKNQICVILNQIAVHTSKRFKKIRMEFNDRIYLEVEVGDGRCNIEKHRPMNHEDIDIFHWALKEYKL